MKRTTRYELVVRLSGRKLPLFCDITSRELKHLRTIDALLPQGFFQVEQPDGLFCALNMKHVARLQVLDRVTYPEGDFGAAESALQTDSTEEATPDLSQEEWEERQDLRENSDDRITLHVWLQDEENVLEHPSISYSNWITLLHATVEHDGFVELVDEDRELLFYNLDRVQAIKMFDSFYLKEDYLEYSDLADEAAPQPTITPPSASSPPPSAPSSPPNT